jgi:hypothetical protein
MEMDSAIHLYTLRQQGDATGQSLQLAGLVVYPH